MQEIKQTLEFINKNNLKVKVQKKIFNNQILELDHRSKENFYSYFWV
jgi:hypothetical protein